MHEAKLTRQGIHPEFAGSADEHLTAALATFLEEFGLPGHLPEPPSGLPGFTTRATNPDAMAILRLGVEYLLAAAKGERRSLWLLHQEAEAAIRERVVPIREYIEVPVQLRTQYATPTTVYFIKAGDGPIKIGIAADVAARMASLQTAHASKLVLPAVSDGGALRERHYHNKFADHRLEGEWFEPHADILAEIERLNTGAQS